MTCTCQPSSVKTSLPDFPRLLLLHPPFSALLGLPCFSPLLPLPPLESTGPRFLCETSQATPPSQTLQTPHRLGEDKLRPRMCAVRLAPFPRLETPASPCHTYSPVRGTRAVVGQCQPRKRPLKKRRNSASAQMLRSSSPDRDRRQLSLRYSHTSVPVLYSAYKLPALPPSSAVSFLVRLHPPAPDHKPSPPHLYRPHSSLMCPAAFGVPRRAAAGLFARQSPVPKDSLRPDCASSLPTAMGS